MSITLPAARYPTANLAEEVYEGMDPFPETRVELLDEHLIMNPPPATDHNRVVYRLSRKLTDLADHRDWELLQNEAIHIPATRERPEPDLVVAPRDAPAYNDHELYGYGVPLVVEVVSPHGRDDDLGYKYRRYALGHVPLYLVIDPLANPPEAVLFSVPTEHGYATSTSVPLGKPLNLPEPFDITLDTGALRP